MSPLLCPSCHRPSYGLTCPRCGYSPLAPGTVECVDCGTRVSAATAERVEDTPDDGPAYRCAVCSGSETFNNLDL